jgi:SAM-dependent methyltransferase
MTVRAFYDALAPRYHLIYADWNASIARQGKALDALIADYFGAERHVVDVAVGIGTQAIGLAERGYEVTGSDLSSLAVRRALAEATRRDLRLDVHVADFRRLPYADESARLILCCDNSLPHVASPDEVRATLAEWYRCLRPGGGCLVSMRDYGDPKPDGTVEERPYGERTWDGHRYQLRQVWTWRGERYETSLEMLAADDDAPAIAPIVTTYLAINPARVAALMHEVGFRRVTRIDERFFQPVLVATR